MPPRVLEQNKPLSSVPVPVSRGSVHPVPVLYLVPLLIISGIFWFFPLIHGFLLSLHADTLYGAAPFIGAGHYKNLLTDTRLYTALTNTIRFALFSLICILPLSLVLAYNLFSKPPWFKNLAGFFLLAPGLTPPSVLAFLFLLVFSGEQGLLNTILLEPFGIAPQNWITNPKMIPYALLIQSLWRWTGFTTLFLLAGLEGQPRHYQEIAQCEGASRLKTFWSIELPLLRPLLIFLVIFLGLDALVLFEGAYVLLGSSGGTADAGLLLVGYSYFQAFSLGHYGYAAALSFALVPLLLLLVGILGLLNRKISTTL